MQEGKRFTIAALRALLEGKYGCTFEEESAFSPAWCLEDDKHATYKTPSGHTFSVPPPTDGVSYSESMVQMIIDASCLEVVVQMAANSDEPPAQ